MHLSPRNKSLKYISKKGLKAKRYFHYVDSFCDAYIKAKEQAHEESKKRRKHSNFNEENYPIFHQLAKPKSGFYALKGCKLASQTTHKVPIKHNGKVLNEFLKKFLQRKQKLQTSYNQQQNSTQMIVSCKDRRKDINSTSVNSKSKKHHQSVIFNIPLTRNKKNNVFLLTQPSCDSYSQAHRTIQQCKSNSPLMPIPLNLLRREKRQVSHRNKCTI